MAASLIQPSRRPLTSKTVIPSSSVKNSRVSATATIRTHRGTRARYGWPFSTAMDCALHGIRDACFQYAAPDVEAAREKRKKAGPSIGSAVKYSQKLWGQRDPAAGR